MITRALPLAVIFAAMSCVQQPTIATAGEAEEAPESAVSSPPMEMDDPGTPGRQGVEVNVVGTLLRTGHYRGSESLLDANYGIGDRLQLKFERPYLTQGGTGAHFQKGLGPTEIGVKWRFVESGGLEVAAYPQYSFNDGYRPRDDEGNPEDKAGSAVYLPVLASKSVKHFYTLAANLGYRRNLANLGDDLSLALGAGRSLGNNARVLTEVFSERDQHLMNRQTDVRVGLCDTLFPKLFAKSEFELDEFASVGHSIGATEEGESSTSFTFGVSVLRKPKGE